MSIIKDLWIRWNIWYYKQALEHLDLNHPDIPHIVLTLRNLEDKLCKNYLR